MIIYPRSAPAALGFLLLVGCVTTTPKVSMTDGLTTGQLGPVIAERRQFEAEGKIPERNLLIHQLEVAQLLRLDGQPAASSSYLDGALRGIEAADQAAAVSVSGEVGEALANPAARKYAPRIADRIHVRLLNALNYLQVGDTDAARVELRGLQDAHEQINNIFARQLAKQEAELAKAREDRSMKQSGDTGDNWGYLKDSKKLAAAWAHLGDGGMRAVDPNAPVEVLARSRMESPAGHLLDALVHRFAPDYDSQERASVSLSFARNMAPAGGAQEVLAALGEPQIAAKPMVWLIHENGMAAEMQQIKVALIFKPSDGNELMQKVVAGMLKVDEVLYMPFTNSLFDQAIFAFPAMVPRPASHAFSSIKLSAASGAAMDSQLLNSVDSMMLYEFKGRLPGLITSAIVGGVIKAIGAQAIVKETKGNPLAQLGLGAVLNGLTMADTRSWNVLPREFRVACIPVPDDGMVMLGASDGVLAAAPLRVTVPTGRHSILHVITPNRTAPPKVAVIPLGTTPQKVM
jgi:uncharacterized protein